MASEWAHEKARLLHGGGEFTSPAHLMLTADALDEAEARGMERAAKVADRLYAGDDVGDYFNYEQDVATAIRDAAKESPRGNE